jgi:hypothetical protein
LIEVDPQRLEGAQARDLAGFLLVRWHGERAFVIQADASDKWGTSAAPAGLRRNSGERWRH